MEKKVIEIRKRDLLIVLLLFIGVAAWLYDRHSLKKQLQEAIVHANQTDTIAQRFKDELQQEHVKGQVRDYTIAELKASKDSDIAQLRKEIGSLKNLVAYSKVSTTTSGTIQAGNKDTIIMVGETSVKATKFDYSDRWLRLTGLKTDDSTKITYSLDNVQKTTWKYERENKKKFWQPKNLIFEIESENPATTVNKVQTVRIPPDKKKFWETQWFSGAVGLAAGIFIMR